MSRLYRAKHLLIAGISTNIFPSEQSILIVGPVRLHAALASSPARR